MPTGSPLPPRHIFLVGPGGVGKTTTGRLLAPLLGRPFVDLDQEFCDHIAPIRSFLGEQGYVAYVRRNASLFRSLLSAQPAPTVFALSSGFLATDVEPAIVTANRAAVVDAGISVLLLPSRDYTASLEIVVARQLQRGLGLHRDRQVATFRDRFIPYMSLADIQVFSAEPPEIVARLIARELAGHAGGQTLI
jgi:shikimate kinase